MKENNKGFTLVELIVCIAIFSVVVVAAFGFMISGSRTYGTVNNRLNLQLQSELTLNQLNAYIIDSNAGICFSGNTLYVLNKDDGGVFTAHIFQFRNDGCIYYGTGAATELESGKFSCNVVATDLLTENVTSFSVTPRSSDGVTAASALVSLTLENHSAITNDERIVALRNKTAIVVIQNT